ncbi:hypothetical protein VTN77DRAFT_8168 [Rasamsonia byssochlamydoides]|uniref:uncharacterized protein n=1 Tax=Rasamsonia byssochlamydoides TaxID=89139 RepID=UPI003744AB0D
MLPKLTLCIKLAGVICNFLLTRLRLAIAARLHRLTYRAVPADSPDLRNIVVIGASFAGYVAARTLATSLPTGYRVVVVEKNSHFQFTWVFPRFSVVRGHEHKAFIPYGPFLAAAAPPGSYQWVRGRVERIEKAQEGRRGFVLVHEEGNDERRIAYDYLVIATGSSTDAGLPSRSGVDDKKDGICAFRNLQDRIENAANIVVIGGGPAGVELAADAKDQYPEKNVMLVHSRDTLLNRFGPKMQEIAMKELERLGVKIVLGERLQLQSADERDGYVVLKSGKKVACDCLVSIYANSRLM